ncbi:hypothetical protein B7Y94_05135 [Candidatus Saccharibacteria bacterium 32-49-12]|nr:MAG: hypothetical protein B7Y94_05135 [Candidatus Saccharibacteria bacterium 32-49-12]
MPVDSAVDSLNSVGTQLRKRLYRLERRDSIDPETARRDVDRRIMVIQRLPGGVFLATRDGWVQEPVMDDSLRLLDSRTHRSRVLHPLMNGIKHRLSLKHPTPSCASSLAARWA